MSMPSWKDDPFRKDLTDKETVIGIARRMGTDYVVVKYKDKDIYNILHVDNKKAYGPNITTLIIP